MLPKWLLFCIAKVGDFLKFKLRFYNFPMNSFRYKNMTSNNIITDLQRTIEATQIGVSSNLDYQILQTLDWLKLNKKNKK
jgi:hypothetical protein